MRFAHYIRLKIKLMILYKCSSQYGAPQHEYFFIPSYKRMVCKKFLPLFQWFDVSKTFSHPCRYTRQHLWWCGRYILCNLPFELYFTWLSFKYDTYHVESLCRMVKSSAAPFYMYVWMDVFSCCLSLILLSSKFCMHILYSHNRQRQHEHKFTFEMRARGLKAFYD